MSPAILVLAAAGSLVSAFSPAPSPAPAVRAVADATADAYKSLAADRGPAIVTIKYVLKDGEEESEEEVQGFLVDQGGLVLTSNVLMGGVPEAFKQMMGGRNRSPKEIKVLIGDDNEGLAGTLVARDSELDLAWVQITKIGDAKPAFVNVESGKSATLGDQLFTVERLGKFNDRAQVINESRVRAVVSKPRTLVLPGRAHESSFGMPVFGADGSFVGVSVLQLPSREEMEADQGGMSAMRAYRGAWILPAADVAKATALAREQAKSGKPVDEEPAAGEKPAEPAEPEAPAAK